VPTHIRCLQEVRCHSGHTPSLALQLLLMTAVLGGCSMSSDASKPPAASTRLPTPADLANATIFDCAENALSA
jgi:hypothetical protein